MSPNSKVRGYAAALFEAARAEGALDEIEEELFRFAKIVEGDSKLREALHDISLPGDHRARMVAELLGSKASPHTINAVGFLIGSGHIRELSGIVGALAEMAVAERTRGIAEVRSAVPLGAEQRERLKAAIKNATGKDVEVRVLVDPSVIGGLLVRVGDQVFDGTVRRRLQQAREQLAPGA